MTTSLQAFEDIILEGDLEALENYLQNATKENREKCAKKALALYKKAIKGGLKERESGSYGWQWSLGENTLKASIHALLATCNHERLKSVAWNHSAIRMVDWELIKRLRPIGLTNFGEILINDSPNYFPYVRKLMALELSKKPASENYIIGIISCPNFVYSKYQKDVPLKQYLLDEKDILDDVLKIFDVEGTQEDSLASVDKYSSNSCNWQNTLIELCNDGHFERSVLFEKTLNSLACDYIQYRSSWFSRFYEALNPTIEERSEHLDKYGLLLGSSIPTTVSFSVKALKKLSSKKALPPEFLTKNITPALYAKSKSTVNSALTLIEASIKSKKQFAEAGCLLIVEALAHESPEVQKKAIQIIQKHGNTKNSLLVGKVEENTDLVSATVLPLLKEWLGDTSKETDSRLKITKTKIDYRQNLDASQGYPFAFCKRIEQIESLEELISVASYCLEHPVEVLEFERVIDAVSRIKINRDKQFEKDTSALNKRSFHFYSAPMHSIVHIHRLHAGFLHAWINKNHDVFNTDKESFFKGLFHKDSFPHIDEGLILERDRLTSILKRNFADEFLPVLSTPTHECGWIDPSNLISRYKNYKASSTKADDSDLIMSMCRCPNSSLKEHFKKETVHTNKDDDFYCALQYQCGLVDKTKIKNKLLSKAASYLRDPIDPGRQIDFGNGSVLTDEDLYETAKWLLITFPSLKETYYKANQNYLYRCIEYMDVSDLRIKAVLESLMESGTPLTENALQLLSNGLIVAETSCRGMAAEALIIALDERRLPIEALGKKISQTLHSENTKPKRLADSLHEVARTSTVHANAVKSIIEIALTGNGSKAPKGLIAVLELLNELAAQEETSITNDATRKYLKAITTGGKTKTVVKQLLS